MLARASLILFAAILALPALADEPKLLDLKPKWKRGDTLRYEMERTTAREVDGKPVRKQTVHTFVELEVIDQDEENSLIRWTQGSAMFDDPKFDDDPLFRATNNIAKGLDIDLELDADGSLVGLRNWKELRASGLKVQDAVLAQMAKGGTTKATIETLRKETDKLFVSKESLEVAFIRPAALLFFPFGQDYELGKPTSYDADIPNVFGGEEPFPAKGEYVLKSVDKDTAIAVILFKQKLDEKETARVLRKWVEDTAKKAGKPAPKELPEVQLEEVMEYEFDLNGGWVKTVTHTRTAKEGNKTQIEVVTLTRKR